MKVLFILKKKISAELPVNAPHGLSTGLFNSASFVNDMLVEAGVDSVMSVVVDNNDIDREVTKHRPTHVIIEALWVVPEKFTILQKLHPTVTWIIRLHSEMPFLAGEGSAMGWIGDYSTCKNVLIACNAPRVLSEVRFFLGHKNDWSVDTASEKVIYLPNYYPTNFVKKEYAPSDVINIGCFGAIRPLKNHLLQAHAALRFAGSIGKKLHFHINTNRLEMKGDSVYHNLQGLFQHLEDKGHKLVGHLWVPREEFTQVCASMDIGMQVTMSETFNIVGADFISQGVPVIGCAEIPWLSLEYHANPVDSYDIFVLLSQVNYDPQANVTSNQATLAEYVNQTKQIWLEYFKEVQ